MKALGALPAARRKAQAMAARVAEGAKSSSLQPRPRHTVSASAIPSRAMDQEHEATAAPGHGSGVTAAYGYAAGYSAHETYGWHHPHAFPYGAYGTAYGGAYPDPTGYYEQSAAALNIDGATAEAPAVSPPEKPSQGDPPPPPPPGEDHTECPPPLPLDRTASGDETTMEAAHPPLPPSSSPPLPPPEADDDIDMAIDEPEAPSVGTSHRSLQAQLTLPGASSGSHVENPVLKPAEAAAPAAVASTSEKKRKTGEGTGSVHVPVCFFESAM